MAITTGELHGNRPVTAAEGNFADLLTVQETAQLLKVTVSWVYDMFDLMQRTGCPS